MLRLVAVLALGAVVAASTSARAQSVKLSPDEEVARREYEAGAEAYARNAYEEALVHFNAAKQAKAASAFDYNIARCLDRLARWQDAADAYERFLVEAPDSESATEVRARIAELRVRRADTPALTAAASLEPAPATPKRRKLRLTAELLIGGALAAGLTASIVYGTLYSAYVAKGNSCPHDTCAPENTRSLSEEKQTRTIVAGVLWGVAGAALVADVALWAIDARRARARIDATRGLVRF